MIPETYDPGKLQRFKTAIETIENSGHPKKDAILERLKKGAEANLTDVLRTAEFYVVGLKP